MMAKAMPLLLLYAIIETQDLSGGHWRALIRRALMLIAIIPHVTPHERRIVKRLSGHGQIITVISAADSSRHILICQKSPQNGSRPSLIKWPPRPILSRRAVI